MSNKLFVICGHGAGDPGGVANGFQEAERVRVLGKRIKELGGPNVILGDINRDYYKDNGISKLTISKEYMIIELHMDKDIPSARGGHVIIQANIGGADKYDIALANFISSVLPGRADKIKERNNLANPARAAEKGYNYRLLECGFISNQHDLDYFNSHIDELAKGILKCFDINTTSSNTKPTKPSKPSTTTTTFKVGDKVGVRKNAKDYNGNPAGGVTREKVCYRIDELKGDRAVLDITGICTAFHTKDLFKNSSNSSSTSKPKMTERQFALEVWNEGKHGTGEKRKQECKKYGVDYNEVQRLINILAAGGKI